MYGSVNNYISVVACSSRTAVRPVIHLDLSKAKWSKADNVTCLGSNIYYGSAQKKRDVYIYGTECFINETLESTIFMAILCIIVFSPVIYQVALKRLHEHAPNSFPTQDKQNCQKV